MRVALDLDMTLNNMAYTWLTWLRADIAPELTMDKIRYFGYIRDAYGKEADAYWKDPSCYIDIQPLHGAIELIKGLHECKHEPFILTHTPEGQSAQVKVHWIHKHFGDIEVIHSGQKHHHTDGCILVDDHPGHIQRHVRHNKGCHGIVYNDHGRYGWAFPLTDHPHVHTAGTLFQVLNLIQDINNGT